MSSPRAHDPAPSARLRAVAVVPARLGSTRLERKMLLAESGRCLFEHTVEAVGRARSIERVVLATDSAEISAAAARAGVACLATSPEHKSGTDRVEEAYRLLSAEGAFDVVLNVQGDEPEIAAEDLDRLVAAFADSEVEAATLWGALRDEEEAADPSVVKVVCDARGDALYFSRATVPSSRHARSGARTGAAACRRHVGVYAYRPSALAEFCALGESELERTESLEQLRWLEAGRRMRVVEARHVPRGIDTRADYEAFLARLASGGGLQRTST